MSRNKKKLFGAALVLYLLWTAATYLFEGRVNMMQQPSPIGRATYVLIANVIIGIGLAGWVLRSALNEDVVSREQLGFRSLPRTLVAIALAGAAGGALFVLQGAASLDPIVLTNVFAQVLTVSIAEVVVCWAVIGALTESLVRPTGRILALVAGIIVADVLFGVYHIGHSAPFNQPTMMLFLMVPGLVTSLVYFLGRDIYAAIIVQNFLGMMGVMQNLDLTFYRRPMYPLYTLMLISILALITVDVLMIREHRHAPAVPASA